MHELIDQPYGPTTFFCSGKNRLTSMLSLKHFDIFDPVSFIWAGIYEFHKQ
jgi:hypothetical protein